MANPASSFAYVFAANAARRQPAALQPLHLPHADERQWQLDAEADARDEADGLNNRKPPIGRRPAPDRR